MLKKCTPLRREAHFQAKMHKHTNVGAPLEVVMLKKRMLLWREAHFQIKRYKAPDVRTTFGHSDVVLRGRRKGFCTLPKSEQNVRVF